MRLRLEPGSELRRAGPECFPSSIYCSTLGGWIAARSSGQLSTRYGSIERRLVGLDRCSARAFVVSDQSGNHGMQIFDLTQLRTVSNPPVTFPETARYGGASAGNLQTAHTLWVNEDTGYAYAFGINASSCVSSGIHMIDLSNPVSPVFVGC